MKVLLVSNIADCKWTGMGRWTYAILNELVLRGHSVDCWFDNKFKIPRYLLRFNFLIFPLLLAFRLVQLRKKFDVVVIHEASGAFYGMLRLFIKSLPPMVVMCHNVESNVAITFRRARDHGFAQKQNALQAFRLQFFRLSQSNTAIRLADHIICLSTIDRNFILKVFRRKPDCVSLMINGVSSDFFTTRNERTLVRDGIRVLFIGGWIDVKGKRLLPLIWKAIVAETNNVQLTLLGTGVEPNAVLADFPEKLRNGLTVIPRVKNDRELRRYLLENDILLMPSLTEGSSLALLEAAASGIAIVATKTGGIPDVIENGVTGLLFEPFDVRKASCQVIGLVRKISRLKALGLEAERRARELTWAASATTLELAMLKVVPTVYTDSNEDA